MGQIRQAISVPVPLSVAAGAAVEIGNRNLNLASLVLAGTFTATYRLQVSIDGGVNFLDWMDSRGLLIGNITATTIALLGGDGTHVRLNCTAFTGGSAVCGIFFPAHYRRADGLVIT